MSNTKNFMLPFFVLVLLAMFVGMNTKMQPVRNSAAAQQETRVEMAVESAVNSVQGLAPEQKQVMMQIMNTSSDN